MATIRRGAAAAGLLASLVLVTGCSSDAGNGGDGDRIEGAGGAATSAPASPSASASRDKDAPAFDLPSDITVTADREETGDATKDAVLSDLSYAAHARVEAFGAGKGQTVNMNRYFAANALVYWVKRVEEFKKDGLTVTGGYRYYGFEVTDVAKGKAAARYCEDQSKAYNKVIKSGEVQRTRPSDKDFVLYTVQTARDSAGDWQVTQQSWKKGDATCLQGQR
ncbi:MULTISPECIES: hypothetical protein [Streptomyces]|uniref:Lipoprotein n=1 Tax=Streptomyces doudnae TaxID=3075536 RepID=A0ABD5EWZ5_9ACTN|nr:MULTISPECIES: hypothetical protein [unclassified Streptomyces]MDT0439276.1 hypothetical protein [Streptomyces sp. DSM 41981]MYQ63447.1 hypothetical protein [Streptomyces sp. SID4950]SCD58405.1 hypothetical protein GA0115242_109412 [Streptomyces sp. SolWspMP-5a-2]